MYTGAIIQSLLLTVFILSCLSMEGGLAKCRSVDVWDSFGPDVWKYDIGSYFAEQGKDIEDMFFSSFKNLAKVSTHLK